MGQVMATWNEAAQVPEGSLEATWALLAQLVVPLAPALPKGGLL